jgi:hypothetical protein
MPKIYEEELELIQVRFFKADLDYLRKIYGTRAGLNKEGINKAIRNITRSYVRQIRDAADRNIDTKGPFKIEFDLKDFM